MTKFKTVRTFSFQDSFWMPFNGFYGVYLTKILKATGLFNSMTEMKKLSHVIEMESDVMMYEYLHDPDH